MRALIYDTPLSHAVERLPSPVPAGDEVLVGVERVGVCGNWALEGSIDITSAGGWLENLHLSPGDDR